MTTFADKVLISHIAAKALGRYRDNKLMDLKLPLRAFRLADIRRRISMVNAMIKSDIKDAGNLHVDVAFLFLGDRHTFPSWCVAEGYLRAVEERLKSLVVLSNNGDR